LNYQDAVKLALVESEEESMDIMAPLVPVITFDDILQDSISRRTLSDLGDSVLAAKRNKEKRMSRALD
jgi:hypothetical protein